MAELNKKQRAGMDLIAGLEQPTAAELECLTILAKVNDLPEEMQEQLDEHLSMQHDLDDTADKLKELKEDVKSKWSAIRGLARNWGQDMFHQGNPPPPPPKRDDDVVVTARYIGTGESFGGRVMQKVADQINAGALDGKKASREAALAAEDSTEGAAEQDDYFVDDNGNPLKGLERAAQQGRVAFVEGKGIEDNPYVQGGHKKSWGAGWNDSLAARDDGWSAFREEGAEAVNPWKKEGFEGPLHRAWEIGRAAAREEAADTAELVRAEKEGRDACIRGEGEDASPYEKGSLLDEEWVQGWWAAEGEGLRQSGVKPSDPTKAVAAPKKAKRAKVKTSSENYPALEIFSEGARAFNAGKTLKDDPYVPFEGMSPQWESQHPISSGFWQKGFKKAMKAWEDGKKSAELGLEASDNPHHRGGPMPCEPGVEIPVFVAWEDGWKAGRGEVE
jgi:ribosome modulation factor